jgi:23S rRNA (cytidine2498-2'-O)-methyltransferase
VTDRALTCYLAARGFGAELGEELQGAGVRVLDAADRLFVTEGGEVPAYWAQNVWRSSGRYSFSSVGEAARILRGMQRNWAKHSIRCHRRSELIQAQLPAYPSKPMRFLDPVPRSPMGSWTLLDEHTLVASPQCSSPFPNGEVAFQEDREAPPSRAYLKLWELFTLHGFHPAPKERCVDLGSAPGGWTWVLASLGARVVSVDRAPLDPRVASLAGVTEIRQSAFGLRPEDVGPVDWLFSDVICLPGRLYDLVARWLDSGLCRNAVCSVKFQGGTDHALVRRFAALPGSRIVHLWHNRHELTWFRVEPASRGVAAEPVASEPG